MLTGKTYDWIWFQTIFIYIYINYWISTSIDNRVTTKARATKKKIAEFALLDILLSYAVMI